MNPRITRLESELGNVRAGIASIETAAADAGRELTEAEAANLESLYARAEDITDEVEPLAARERKINAAADVLATLHRSTPTGRPAPSASSTPATMTPGEYFAGYFRSLSDPAAAEEFHARSVASQILSDTPGLLPVPIVGELIKFADSTRTLFTSLTPRPMPAGGKTFQRPRVTQRTTGGEQTTELTELASRVMKVVLDNVNKRTFGGVLNLSQQEIDWTDPAALDLVLTDFAEVYAEITEDAAGTWFETLATNESPFDQTTVTALVRSLAEAAVEVYGTCKRFPDTIWLGLNRWVDFASMTDNQDQLVFPSLGAGSIDLTAPAFGGSPLNLRPVIAPTLDPDALIIGRRGLAEVYEQRNGLLQATHPSILGREIAYSGYVAFYGRTEGFVKLVES